jgi:MFS family permease
VRDRRPLGGLLAANAISITGSVLTLLAIPWFVLQTTGSATKTGITAGVSTIPVVLSAAFSGTLADRIGLRLTSIGSDLASAAIVVTVPVLHATVGVAFWQVLALVFLRSFFATPGETARAAILPDLVDRAGASLERATSGYDAVSRGARMVGAPVAGVLIATLGAPNLLVLDAVSFVVSALLVATLVPKPPPRTEEREPVAYLADMREGLRYLRVAPVIRATVVLCMCTNMLDAGYSVFLPVHAKEVLHSSAAFGVIVGVFGGSALAGALLYAAFGARLPRRGTFVVAFLLCGFPRYAMLALHLPVPALVAIGAVCGLGAGALNPIMDTVIFETVPAHLRARVWGVVYAGCSAAMPLGAFVAGLSVSGLGLSRALWAFGLVYLVATSWPAFGRDWAGLDRAPAEAAYATMPA